MSRLDVTQRQALGTSDLYWQEQIRVIGNYFRYDTSAARSLLAYPNKLETEWESGLIKAQGSIRMCVFEVDKFDWIVGLLV